MEPIHIRQATPEDAAAIARFHVGGWQSAYRGLLPDAYLEALDLGESEARHRETLRRRAGTGRREWVLEAEGVACGWAAAGPARDEDLGPEVYELMAIYLDPACIGRGYGRALMGFCIEDGVQRLVADQPLRGGSAPGGEGDAGVASRGAPRGQSTLATPADLGDGHQTPVAVDR